MNMPCDGQWSSFPRTIETESPDPITVQTCSGCSEIMVIFRSRSVPTGLDRHATDDEITAAVCDYFYNQALVRREQYLELQDKVART